MGNSILENSTFDISKYLRNTILHYCGYILKVLKSVVSLNEVATVKTTSVATGNVLLLLLSSLVTQEPFAIQH